MPLTAQYKTMGGRTAIDDILDLDDSADQQRQVNNKYIRNHQRNPPGMYAPGMQRGGPRDAPQQMMAQEMISSLHPADPPSATGSSRYATGSSRYATGSSRYATSR